MEEQEKKDEAELVYFNDFAPIYVGKAMKDSAPRVYGNTPMEAGICKCL